MSKRKKYFIEQYDLESHERMVGIGGIWAKSGLELESRNEHLNE